MSEHKFSSSPQEKNTFLAREDKEDEEDIEPLISSLRSKVDKFCREFDDMEADFVRAKTDNRVLAERNRNLAKELDKAKEQYSKKFQYMKAELGRADIVYKDLGKRNKKLEEELRKAKRQNWKKFLDIKIELVTAKSENENLVKRNNQLEEELRKLGVELHDVEGQHYELKEELYKARERENSSKRSLEQTKNKLQELCTTLRTTFAEECDQICNQQEYPGAAPHISKKRKRVLKVYEVNDRVNCPICLEPWTESGEHNVCSLSCGHFFGRSCITDWIESRGSSTCPVCNRRATSSDIRHHYVSQIYNGVEKIEQAD